MVTGNGDSRYPLPPGNHDLPSRRRIPNPPRLDPLRINPPSPRSTRPPPVQRPLPIPRSPRKHLEQPPPLHDPFLRSASPHHAIGDEFSIYGPALRTPTFPIAPHDRPSKATRRDGDFDRPSHRKAPGLRASKSTSRLNPRRPRLQDSPSSSNDPFVTHGLALPRPPHASPDAKGEDVLRSSVNSAMTSRSSIEQASGTERSSVLTKSSSITDLSPDTPDGPHEKDGGMSVEDAISMYLDGFSDVTEEPASPDLHADAKVRPLSPRPPTELTIDDGYTSDERSPALDATKDLPPVPPMPALTAPTALNPPDQNTVDKQFLGEAKPEEQAPHEILDESLPEPPVTSVPEETKVVIPGIVPPPLLPGTDSRDRYGFRKASHHVTIDQYEAWNGPYAAFAATRKVKWTELLREHGLPTEDPTAFPAKSNKIKRFVRKGIPSEYRGAAWFWYAGGFEHLNRNPGLYEQLVKQAMDSPSNDDKEHIERDLHRTFPDNLHFKPETQAGDSGSSNPKFSSVIVETQMIESLRRVLYAFSLHNPQVGYTQSLNFITGMLLLFLTEEKAFWMLHIITSVYLPGTHEISLEGANIDLWILMVLLKEALPSAYNKIANTGSSPRAKTPPLTVHSRLPDITLGLTNWLMSVFIGTLPLETTLRVWDVFFFEGSKTFFRVSLAIFKACERDIMAVSDPMEVFQVVQSVPKRLLDANHLMDECFARRHRVGQGRIEELRASRRTAVRQEKLRRSQALSKGQLQAATDEWPTRSRTPIPGIERSIADSWRHMKHHAFR